MYVLRRPSSVALCAWGLLVLMTPLAPVHTATNSTYRAAVLEHQVLRGKTPLDTMYNNVKEYAKQTMIAADQGADIIVFPEYGITGLPNINRDKMLEYLQHVPDPTKVKWNACAQDETAPRTEIIRELSCMARNNSIVVVANLGTVEDCSNETDPNCPPDARYQFNTNLAFGSDGVLLAKYHKHHLFGEASMDPSPEPEYIVFDAGFAKFGTFICFDIMFFDPAIKLVKNLGVRNIAYPTVWVDQLPFLTAVQAQAMWSYGLGVNLLAANCFHPDEGALGSGIYSSVNGALNYTYDPSVPGRLILADVPIIPEVGPILDPEEEVPPVLRNTPLFKDLGTKVTKVVKFGPLKQHARPKRDTEAEAVAGEWEMEDDLNMASANEIVDYDINDTSYSYQFHGRSAEERNSSMWDKIQATTSEEKELQGPTVPSSCQHHHLIHYESMENFSYVFLKGNAGQESVCDNGLCCDLSYGLSGDASDDVYALVGANKERPSFSGHTFAEQVCVVVRCITTNISTCGRLQDRRPQAQFELIRLSGNFTTKYAYPTMFTTDLTLVPTDEWQFHKQKARTLKILSHPNSVHSTRLVTVRKTNIAVLRLVNLKRPVLTAGIYGRPYEDEDKQRI